MRVLRFVHRWLGIVLALPLLVMGLTGVILTLEPAWPEFGPAPQPGLAVQPANAILAAAQAEAPAGMRAARYLPGQAGGAAQVFYAPLDNPRGPGLVLRLDPGTARPLGPPESSAGVMNWIKRLHENLLLPQYGGRQIAGWFGVGLVVLVVIGIPLWWPRPGQVGAAFTVPRRARGWRLQRALHGAAGGWLSVLLLIVGVTGVTQGFPQTVRQVLGLPAGGPPRGGGRPERGAAPAPDLDAAIARAQGALPGLVPRVVFLPQGNEPVRLIMAPPGSAGVVAARQVTVDAAGTRVISAQGEPSAAEAVLRWNKDLHEATGLGPVYQGLMAVTGLSLPLFGVTGIAMWLLKRRNRRRVAARTGSAEAAAGQI